MIIRNVSRADLDNALAQANQPSDTDPDYIVGHGGNGFDGNLRFKRIDRTTKYHYPLSGSFDVYAMSASWRVTLTVHSSRAPGARRSTDGSRRIAAACWHAHGAFMQALPPTAIVKSSAGGEYRRIIPDYGQPKMVYIAPPAWSPGDELRDYNIGSQMYPCMASEACEC